MTTAGQPTVLDTSEELGPGERRSAVRYSPDPLVPVFFAHPSAGVPTAGHIADISDSGVRIVAPPTARPMLHWGDALRIIVTYSESAREAGIEGMRLWAHVVRMEVDSREFQVMAAFSRGGSDGDWNRLSEWIDDLAVRTAAEAAGLAATTAALK
ncbi:MAG: PilZ domain-containing protein [Myxococcales bacterium]|nr:PilZ domain-containing protein [Myxococcales bacterium]